ncbi:MAG: cyclic nucleotide-binding domain-containing protein [Bryobacteraceae bacterium]
MSATRTELLQRIPMFAGLEPEVIDALTERAATRPFAPGQVLFDEGDGCEGMFLLVQGSVKIFKS